MVEEAKQNSEPTDPQEVAPRKAFLIAKLKKYAIPASLGLAAFVISVLIYTFFFDGGKDNSNVTAEKAENMTLPQKVDSSRAKTDASFLRDTSFTAEDVKNLEIDTTEIMKGLDFLFGTPETEKAEADSVKRDSSDTLGNIQKEMAKLEEQKLILDIRQKEIDARSYKVDQGLKKLEQAESARVTNLARLYDGMKPNDVAKLFENLDDEIILTILPRMKPVNASKILGLMPPKRAAEISTRMITVVEK